MKRAIVLAGAFAIAVAIVPDPVDSFRYAKTLLFRAEAILLAAVWIYAYRGRAEARPHVVLPCAALAVVALLTLTSTNRTLSIDSLIGAAATLVVFLATVSVADDRAIVAVPVAAALINALLVILEETNLWMPFGVQPGVQRHLQCNALVGNPNEVGCYLGTAALMCLAMRRRWLNAAAIVLIAGLIASRTLTAFIALGLAALTLVPWKRAAAALAMVAVVVALAAPLRERAINTVHWLKSGDYNSVVTERLTFFAAAWSMFVDHPIAGVGPGAFEYQYYDYKLGAEQRYPSLRRAYNRGINAGEVHNDHLQVLAEGGILGYAAFAMLIGALAFRNRTGTALAVYIVVLSLAQFPIESTVVRALIIHFAAICVGRREET